MAGSYATTLVVYLCEVIKKKNCTNNGCSTRLTMLIDGCVTTECQHAPPLQNQE
jgi:hypothetical protein